MNKGMKGLVAGAIAISVLMFGLAFILKKEVTIKDRDRMYQVKTISSDMSKIFDQCGIEIFEEDEVYPEVSTKLTDGMTIEIDRAFTVRIAVGEEILEVKTISKDVSDILEITGIELGINDRVYPSIDEEIGKDKFIEVVRVASDIVQVEEVMPHGTVFYRDADMKSGEYRFVSEGSDGLKMAQYEVLYENDEEISRKLIGEEIMVSPVDEVIKKGSEKYVVTDRGDPYMYREVYVMTATAYDLSYESCGKLPGHPQYGITRSGTHARPGVIAVDPRVIELGADIYVESLDGMNDYGFSKAEDTGSAIKGNRVDLFIEDRRQALRYGVRNVKVYVLEESVSEEMMEGYSN